MLSVTKGPQFKRENRSLRERHQQWHLAEVDYLGAIYVDNGDFICRIKKSPKDRYSSCPDLHMIQVLDIYCF